MIEEQYHVMCSEGCVAGNSLLQRFNLAFGAGGWTSLNPPIDRSSLIPITRPEACNTMDTPCAFCNSNDAYNKNAYYLRKAELLIIACPCHGAITWE